MSKPNVEILATKDWVTSLINKVIKRRDSDIKIHSNTARSMRSSHCSSALFVRQPRYHTSLTLVKGVYTDPPQQYKERRSIKKCLLIQF